MTNLVVAIGAPCLLLLALCAAVMLPDRVLTWIDSNVLGGERDDDLDNVRGLAQMVYDQDAVARAMR